MINGTSFRSQAEAGRQASLAKTIATEQQKISSGTRLLKASDDAAAAVETSALRKTLGTLGVSQRNINYASSLASMAETNLASGQILVGQAQETLQAAASGTANGSDRAIAASALRQMATDLRALAQAKTANGDDIFPTATPVRIPVGDDFTAATISRSDAFEVSYNGRSIPIADLIDRAADALVAPTSTAQDRAAYLDPLASAEATLTNGRASVGMIGSRLERLSAEATDRDILVRERLGELLDTNVAESISKITSGQVTLQAAQAVYARLNQSSLFDLLR